MLEMSLFTAGRLSQMTLKDPFQLELFYNSVTVLPTLLQAWLWQHVGQVVANPKADGHVRTLKAFGG